MNEQKRQILSWSIALVILLVIAGALLYSLICYHVVDFRFYPKDATNLDLRGQKISFAHYQRLSNRMPGCEILWDVPFQGKLYSSDTQDLTVTSLTDQDLIDLYAFSQLKTLDAMACQDYPQLLTAMRMYPKLEISYQVSLGGKDYRWDVRDLRLSGLEAQEIERMGNLPLLERVTLEGAENAETVTQLEEYCKNHGLMLFFKIQGEIYPDDVQELTLTGAAPEDLSLLPSLTGLKKVHLKEPNAAAGDLFALAEACPKAEVTWEYTLDTVTIHMEDTAVDLSGAQLTDIEQVEKALTCFPNVKEVFLGDCGLDNEALAAWRERARSQYKLVWLIHLGDSRGTLRTDITYFFPGRDGMMGGYVFNDNTSYNLRYCEDLICVDVGHLGVHEISWCSGLVNLEYLILAHTGVISLEGIENCKKLKFLEIHWTGVRDLAPLKGLTALEDLNFGKTWPDVSALTEMPWLKNIYMIKGSSKDAAMLAEALPDTNVVISGSVTVASGWRRLPNYYAMRDALNAPYMN